MSSSSKSKPVTDHTQEIQHFENMPPKLRITYLHLPQVMDFCFDIRTMPHTSVSFNWRKGAPAEMKLRQIFNMGNPTSSLEMIRLFLLNNTHNNRLGHVAHVFQDYTVLDNLWKPASLVKDGQNSSYSFW